MSLAYTSDPRRAARSDGEYGNCSLLMGPISGSECERRSSSSQNELACKRCPSPFRTCIPCFKQHIPRHAQGQVNSRTGFCPFHDEHGPEAVRTYTPPPALKEDPGHPAQDGRKATQAPTDGLDPVFIRAVPHELIERGVAAYGRLKPRHVHLMKLYARGLWRTRDLAHELERTETFVSVLNTDLKAIFQLPIDGLSRHDAQKYRATACGLIELRAARA